jgi:ribonuclease T2
MLHGMRRVISLVLAGWLAATGCKGPGPSTGATGAKAGLPQAARPRAAGSSANFDYYLLNLSWSPEYCHSHPTAAECAAHSTFVLHGLWPENNDGSYPENCSNAPGPADPSQYSDIYPDPSLLEHEWQTHGTCSGLGPDAFFQAARTAFHSVAIPPRLSGLTQQISLAPDEIVGLFQGSNAAIPQASFAVSCGNQLPNRGGSVPGQEPAADGMHGDKVVPGEHGKDSGALRGVRQVRPQVGELPFFFRIKTPWRRSRREATGDPSMRE